MASVARFGLRKLASSSSPFRNENGKVAHIQGKRLYWDKLKAKIETPEREAGIKRDIARSNWWEQKEIQQHPDGKVVPHTVFASVAESPSWPPALSKFIFQRKIINLTEEFTNLYKDGQVASIVVVSQKRPLAHGFIKTWIDPIVAHDPSIPVFDIILLQNVFYRWLNPLWQGYWKSRAPKNPEQSNQQSPNYKFLYTKLKSVEPKDVGINIENSLTSYIYLIDNKTGKIRFQSSGLASPAEIDSLKHIVQRLKELRK